MRAENDRGAPRPADDGGLVELARHLPAGIHFGTSSWSFPGWYGLVYSRRSSSAALAREGLREYAEHPLFRTVGLDRGYYAPIPESDLRRYASQLPAGFRCCLKAPATLTSVVLPDPHRAGRAAPNPLFLSVDHLVDDVLGPCERAFAGHLGAIMLEFPPVPPEFRLEPSAFASRLHAFLEALPAGWPYAVEIRDRRLLSTDYAAVLARHGVAHVYNYWSAMPPIGRQLDVVPSGQAPFAVARLLLAPGTRYEARREAYRPFDRIVDPDPAMRSDVIGLLDRAVRARQPAYVLVNNKAEGCSPLTIRAIVEAWIAGRHPDVRR